MVAALAETVAAALPPESDDERLDTSVEAGPVELDEHGQPIATEAGADPERKRRRRRSRRGRRAQEEGGTVSADAGQDEAMDGEDNLAAEAQAALSEVATPVSEGREHPAPVAQPEPSPARPAGHGTVTAAPGAPAGFTEEDTPAVSGAPTATQAQPFAAQPAPFTGVSAPSVRPEPVQAGTAAEDTAPRFAESAPAQAAPAAPVPAQAAPAQEGTQAAAAEAAPVSPWPAVPQSPASETAPVPTPVRAADEGVPHAAPAVPAAPAGAAPVTQDAAPQAAPAVPRAPQQSLQDVVNAAGLTWVETDPQRHAQTQQRMAASATPVRLGRERKPVAPVSREPLVQVETRH
ncbi:hypothetical protein BOFL111202_23425 [Bordetella flabilis]